MLAFRTRFRVRARSAPGRSPRCCSVLPAFWLGLLLVIVFAAELGWLPSAGYVAAQRRLQRAPQGADPADADPRPAADGVVLPLSERRSAATRRAPRSSPRRGRAGSASGRSPIGHVLPNAALPTLTVVGLVVGSLISGLVIVESVFSWPGLGLLLVDSVKTKDYNTVAAIVLITAVDLRRRRLRRRHPLPRARPAHQAGERVSTSCGRAPARGRVRRRQPRAARRRRRCCSPRSCCSAIVPGLFAPHDPLRIEAIPL